MRATLRDKPILAALKRSLPPLDGDPIRISFLPSLHASRGRLHSGASEAGQPVHAASFLRERRIVLDSALRGSRVELTRVLLHELFHFVWARLGNPARRSYEELLEAEMAARARGELGWSAETRKRGLDRGNERAWRDYLCESFCDSAAWFFAGLRRHEEVTLARRHRERRAEWFRTWVGGRAIPI